MPLYRQNTELTNAYRGTTELNAIYKGTAELWTRNVTPTEWIQLGGELDKSGVFSNFNTFLGQTWWFAPFTNSTIAARDWKLVCTVDAGDSQIELWKGFWIADSSGNTYNSVAASGLSFSGPIATSINNPPAAFNGNYSNNDIGICARPTDSRSLVGSTAFFSFNSPVTLNTIRIQTVNTKARKMELYYFG